MEKYKGSSLSSDWYSERPGLLVLKMMSTVLSLLLLSGCVWVRAAANRCDFDKVVTMPNVDFNQLKGKWYVSHLTNLAGTREDVNSLVVTLSDVTQSSANVALSLDFQSGSCLSLSDSFNIISNATLSGATGLLRSFVYRVLATDYTNVAAFSSEEYSGGQRIESKSSIDIMVRDPNHTPNLAQMADALKAPCGDRALDIDFYLSLDTDHSALCPAQG